MDSLASMQARSDRRLHHLWFKGKPRAHDHVHERAEVFGSQLVEPSADLDVVPVAPAPVTVIQRMLTRAAEHL